MPPDFESFRSRMSANIASCDDGGADVFGLFAGGLFFGGAQLSSSVAHGGGPPPLPPPPPGGDRGNILTTYQGRGMNTVSF